MNFIVSLLIKSLTAFLFRFMTAFATEQVFAYTLFSILKAGAKSTKTEWDDEWVQKMEDAYKNLGK